MQRSKIDVWVGLFVLIGGVAILFLALQSANLLSLNFQSTYRVAAKFDNVGGLKRDAAVPGIASQEDPQGRRWPGLMKGVAARL